MNLPKYVSLSANRRDDLLAGLLGAVTATTLPPFHVLPLLLLTIPALLRIIDRSVSTGAALRRGFLFGFGLNLFGLYWITEAILIEADRFWWLVPLAVPALSLVLAVFIAVPCGLCWRVPAGPRRLAAFCGLWVLADLARQFVATGFPWNPLGSDWAVPGLLGDIFIQPAALIGVHGLTLATLGLAGAVHLGRRGGILAVAGIAIWGIVGWGMLQSPARPAPGLSVILVQGNVAQGQKWNQTIAASIFDSYLSLSESALTSTASGHGIVVWPETASPYLLQTDRGARSAIQAIVNRAQLPALIGSVRFGADDRPRNSLMAIPPSRTGDQDGGLLIYDKWHLVPFGEYIPDWLPFGVQLVAGGGFAPGDGPRTLHPPGIPPVGPLICYEAIFTGQIVDSSDRPDWLVNVTNDAWFGNSAGPRQHLAAARLRAVEEGLPLMRAANTGISAGFDAHGHELGRIALNQRGVLILPLPGPLPPTLYARWGLAIPTILALLSLAAGLIPGRLYRSRRMQPGA
jgi:apolipoprotein N-acyltransferase